MAAATISSQKGSPIPYYEPGNKIELALARLSEAFRLKELHGKSLILLERN
jgi:hypothetical protein